MGPLWERRGRGRLLLLGLWVWPPLTGVCWAIFLPVFAPSSPLPCSVEAMGPGGHTQTKKRSIRQPKMVELQNFVTAGVLQWRWKQDHKKDCPSNGWGNRRHVWMSVYQSVCGPLGAHPSAFRAHQVSVVSDTKCSRYQCEKPKPLMFHVSVTLPGVYKLIITLKDLMGAQGWAISYRRSVDFLRLNVLRVVPDVLSHLSISVVLSP